ncbi:MAG: aspartate ammonia-lyase [archaeon]
MRKEKDSLGELIVPDDALFGVHTTRSMGNFSVADEPFPLLVIHAMARLKSACASANEKLDLLDKKKGDAIRAACAEVVEGTHDDQFPIDMFQAGSGTSSNMNLNEVVANLAVESMGGKRGDRSLVHPNDDVNKGQSTNNLVPSGIRVAIVLETPKMLSTIKALSDSLAAKGKEFSSIIKSARTHLQDAVPITLGQEFDCYARALDKAATRIEKAGEELLELGVGGNAVGTGLNTKKDFRSNIIEALNKDTKKKFTVAVDGMEATQFLTDIGAYSATLRSLASDMLKIVNDLRLLSSGPNTGLGEIRLPAVEPGSSIMPGKINPSICEAANMACMQSMGLDHAVSLACSAGQLELNTHMPLVGGNVLKQMRLLSRTCRILDKMCVQGIGANKEVCAENFSRSAGLATVLNPKIGYDKVAELVKESLASGKTLKELVLEKKILDERAFDDLVKSATAPNL